MVEQRPTIERQLHDARQNAQKQIDLIEPSPDEIQNGWTAESLTAYIREQSAAQSLRIDPASQLRYTPPRIANNRYRPIHHWRRR